MKNQNIIFFIGLGKWKVKREWLVFWIAAKRPRIAIWLIR